ncbi:MAG: TetR/AcrR family transcriptional regulator [Actinobacteria bacterium]|nr:TetR/AcrR family transcriptional regulator [Actinomycetota bacterium]
MTSTAAARPRRRYPRGEGERLRADILAAAKGLLADTGDVDSVSIRLVADRVGVSTPSIYHHFEDKAALITAVCEDVFAELDRRMQEAVEGIDDPFDALRERGLAYCRFALANPEHYRIVMMSLPHEGESFTAHDLVAGPTFEHLIASVVACQESGAFPAAEDPTTIAMALWASVHGAVSLVLTKPGIAGDDPLAFCAMVLEATGTGIAVSHLPEFQKMHAQD